jgi:WS/DGAT/MGAT family acyltransferase
MSTLDAGFYFVEHENVPMHIGSLAVFEGPAPAFTDLLALFAAKLPRVPRYRQVVRTTPLHMFWPTWADDEHFELGYHVRRTAVPRPGGRAELKALAARVFAQRLDRARPLWEAWQIEGLRGGRWALLSKVHHCMVDGIGGSDLLAQLFSLDPQATIEEPSPWTAEQPPSLISQVTSGMLDAARSLRQLAELPAFLRGRLGSPADFLRFGAGLAGGARRLAAPAASSLNGAIGPHRRWTWTTASLSEVKDIRSALGVTVNDVVLAVITSAFRDLLELRGELADGRVVRSLVPVSLRGADEREAVSNRISAVLVNLPVGEQEPLTRLRLLHEQMGDLKGTRQAAGAEVLTELLGFAAPALLALGTRSAFRIPQPLVQAVTTNIPGPRVPLFILGRQMEAAHPYVPIANNLNIGIAIFSYLDRFSFGITADYSAVSDAELVVLIKGIKRGLADLGRRAARAQSTPPSAG